MKALLSYLPPAAAILVCALLGSFVSHWLIGLTGWQGTGGAIATLVLSMLLAFAFFVLGVAVLNALRGNASR